MKQMFEEKFQEMKKKNKMLFKTIVASHYQQNSIDQIEDSLRLNENISRNDNQTTVRHGEFATLQPTIVDKNRTMHRNSLQSFTGPDEGGETKE